MPAPGYANSPFFSQPETRALFDKIPVLGASAPDYADLERRVADLEDRAMRQDKEAATRDRLKAMGLVLPARS